MHKKPIYGGKNYSDKSNSDITFRDIQMPLKALDSGLTHHRNDRLGLYTGSK